ncbi:hypothetical protein IMZ11_20250 [Microtetraspora sp. AC03309]|uniref:hypothetical protein n=1 Tax=Microtetraspora sp. AC03309 TaxID=2779376 RepID=UPI001E49F46F|nr:hypothetical protein [Microtetraspora sp. AC03309]MCC5577962.1 hypothetical protein [Microtetraspora sp. AC03309]
MLTVILDDDIVTVALPAIRQDLDSSPTDATRIVYVIAFGGLPLRLPRRAQPSQP